MEHDFEKFVERVLILHAGDQRILGIQTQEAVRGGNMNRMEILDMTLTGIQTMEPAYRMATTGKQMQTEIPFVVQQCLFLHYQSQNHRAHKTEK